MAAPQEDRESVVRQASGRPPRGSGAGQCRHLAASAWNPSSENSKEGGACGGACPQIHPPPTTLSDRILEREGWGCLSLGLGLPRKLLSRSQKVPECPMTAVPHAIHRLHALLLRPSGRSSRAARRRTEDRSSRFCGRRFSVDTEYFIYIIAKSEKESLPMEAQDCSVGAEGRPD